MGFPVVTIQLPDWVEPFVAEHGKIFPSIEDKMALVIELSRENALRRGGPFAAAVFDHEGQLIAPGINMVTTSNCSVLHAEIVALALAQNLLQRYDLGDAGRLHYDLVASTEPCAMCFGAVPWSGISRLICGARDEDARAVGFDEGPKLPNWVEQLNSRNIDVIRDVHRDKAASVLRTYAASGGTIYNAGKQNKPAPN